MARLMVTEVRRKGALMRVAFADNATPARTFTLDIDAKVSKAEAFNHAEAHYRSLRQGSVEETAFPEGETVLLGQAVNVTELGLAGR